MTRKFLWLLTVLFLAPGHLAEAQPKKVPRIGVLHPGASFYAAPLIEAFSQRLRELGYVEGKNIRIEYSYAEGKRDRYVELATNLADRKVDVIVVASTPAIQAVKRATTTIPIVMAAAADPVGTGLIDSLARPGGNITGSSMRSPEVSGKRLELIKEVVPKAKRVGILWNPTNESNYINLKDTLAAAQSMGLQLLPVKVEDPSAFDAGFKALVKGRINAFTVFRDSLLLVHSKQFVAFAAKNRLAAVYDGREFTLGGGLMSYTPNHLDLYRQAATYVDKILKGAKPADLPVEQPMRFEFIINLKAAKQIGVTIPPNVLARADKVIK
jgi:ABC-type uncharacterized transport system substrate-binding protein